MSKYIEEESLAQVQEIGLIIVKEFVQFDELTGRSAQVSSTSSTIYRTSKRGKERR